MLYSGEPINLTPLVKAGTSAVAHLEKHLERALDGPSEPLSESFRMMVQDGRLLIIGEFNTASLEYAD